ncbi:alpha/beta hydrolase [Salinicoccus sp. Marseille-QA3877]
MVRIDSKDINNNFFDNLTDEEVIITHNDEDFYFKFDINKQYNKIVVHTNGALKYDKKTPPVYQRSTWSNLIDASCIFIDDKTLHNISDDSFNTAWLMGTKNRYYVEDYSEIIKVVQRSLDIEDSDVYYWGTSAGGTSSIALATLHSGTTAIANNPQTNILTDYPRRKEALFRNIFPDMTEDDIIKTQYHRLSLAALMKKMNHVPRIFYIQNNAHKADIKRHFTPFVNELDSLKLDTNKITFWLYHDTESGHSPLIKSKTLEYLHAILSFKHL